MKKKLTSDTRLILAVISMVAEQVAIWALWRWLLPEMGVTLSAWGFVSVMAAWLVAGVFIYVSGSGALKAKEYAGLSSMIGMSGKAVDNLSPHGMVMIKGELWKATAEERNIADGENFTVIGEDGLKLRVRKTL